MNSVFVIKMNFEDTGWQIDTVIPVNGNCVDEILDLAQKIERIQEREDIEIRVEIQFLS